MSELASSKDCQFAAGYRLDRRKVGIAENGNEIIREIYTKGEHSVFCQVQAEGWVCDHACMIKDMESISVLKVIVDDLVEVREDAWRRAGWKGIFGVYWKMTRISLRRTFKNGRSVEKDADYSSEDWYRGYTHTKWGARRQMRARRVRGVRKASSSGS